MQLLILCVPCFPLKLNVRNCWHVYVGVAMKEFGLIYTINSKEINKPVHEVLLEEQHIQRKTSFLFCNIWPTDLFHFKHQLSVLEPGDFWDDKWRSLVQLQLHWQKWCYHFSRGINTEGLSQTSTLLSWANVLLESTEYVWYVKANKNINVIKQLAFFYVEHGIVVKLLTW
jgi:hypothetical protein